MMKSLVAAAAALSLTTAGPVLADVGAADRPDLECLAVVAIMAGQNQDNAEAQAGLAGGMMYYLGKLEGRTPGVDWLAELTNLLKTLELTDVQAAAPRCGQEMQAKGQALVNWGTTVQAQIAQP